MSLKTRFTVACLGLVFAVLAATGSLHYLSERRHLSQAQLEREEAVVRALAKPCEEALLEGNELAILNLWRPFVETKGLLALAVIGPDGRYALHSGLLSGDASWRGQAAPAYSAAPAPGATARTLVPGRISWTAALEPAGKGPHRLLVEYDRAVVEAEAARAVAASARRFASVAALCLALGLLGAWVLARLLYEPLRAIAEGTRRFAAGRLDHRIQIRDSSELAALAAQLNEMARQIRETQEMKQRFFHELTHDLRVPLASVQGYVELLLSGKAGPLPDAQRKHLLQVEEGARILGDFAENILDLAKLENGKPRFAFGTCSVREAADAALRLVQVQAERLGVEIESDVAVELPRAPMPEELLRRVLANLLSNALKFTPSGKRVRLTANTGGDTLLLRVIDDGCGIPPDKLSRLFTEFYKVPETLPRLRGPAGVGIGLAICKVLVESHGGRIWVESEYGKGATFSVSLPAVGAAPRAAAGAAA